MPIYDLKCKTCANVDADVLMSMKDDPADATCSKCGAKGMERIPCRVRTKSFGGKWSTVDPSEGKR